MSMTRRQAALTMAAGALAPAEALAARGPAERIFIGRAIHTMTNRRAEALAVRDGIIISVGSAAQVRRLASPLTQITELGDRALLPGFIQAHAHFSAIAQKSMGIALDPPPIGTIASIDALVGALRAAPADAGPIVGIGYDDTLLAEKRHPTRHDLDRVSTDRPVVAYHISLHFAAMNTKALALAGIDASTADPPGGVIRREAGGRAPDGVLEENALLFVRRAVPMPTAAQALAAFARTATLLASKGVTTATDHASEAFTESVLREFAARGGLPIDLVAHRLSATGLDGMNAVSRSYTNRFRLGGLKIVVDGSLQGRTGYLTQPYYRQREGDPANYRGYPSVQQDKLDEWVRLAHEKNWPLLAHTNGDAATDMLVQSVRAAQRAFPRADIRPTIIHAQTIREDQLDAARALRMIPSFFVDHVYFWGDRHRDVFLGPERAARISPCASAKRRGMRFTIHDDAPVTPSHPLRTVGNAVNRITAAGAVLGADQRITVLDALRATTADAAFQMFEETTKGTLQVGKRADLVVLEADPLTVEPAAIGRIEVHETIKDGTTVFAR